MDTKVCIDCQIEKSIEDFYFANKTKTSRYSRCKKCYNQRRYNWPMAIGNKELFAENQRRIYKELKTQVLDYLGNKCVRCGYDENPLGLDVDHIDRETESVRRKRKGTSSTDLRNMLKSNCVGLQLLCGTCHHIKTRTENIELNLYY